MPVEKNDQVFFSINYKEWPLKTTEATTLSPKNHNMTVLSSL